MAKQNKKESDKQQKPETVFYRNVVVDNPDHHFVSIDGVHYIKPEGVHGPNPNLAHYHI